MNYTITEADKAAAEKAGLAEEAAHNRRFYSYTSDYEPNAIAKRYFLQGVSYAKASASPAPEEWERLRNKLALVYREAECGEHVDEERKQMCGVDFCTGFDDALKLIAEPLKAELEKARAENAAMKEALEKVLGPYELPFPQSKEDCKPIEIARKRREYDVSVATHALAKLQGAGEKVPCPPHSWDSSGERCTKCGDKDWMT